MPEIFELEEEECAMGTLLNLPPGPHSPDDDQETFEESQKWVAGNRPEIGHRVSSVQEATAQEYKEVDFHLTTAMQTLSARSDHRLWWRASNVMNHPPPMTLGLLTAVRFWAGRRLSWNIFHHFEWYLPGKIRICYGYVSFRECTGKGQKICWCS